MTKKVLLGEISSYKSIVIAEFIKTYYPDILVIGYDYLKGLSSLHTKHCDDIVLVENPKKCKKKHVESLSEVIKQRGIDYFIPVDSQMYGVFVNAKPLFGNAFGYVGDYNIYELLHDKSKSQELAKMLSIRIPKFYKNLNDAKIPFVIKPTNLSSSKGVQYVKSDKQKKYLNLSSAIQYVFQEYIDGIGCGYSVFVKNGEIVAGHGHVRLAEFPISGGSSVYRKSFMHEEMLSISKRILNYSKWSGFAMFEFKLTPANEIVLIEVNPRIWGSINQGLQNGANFLMGILGPPSVEVKDKQVNTYLAPLVYLAFFKYMLIFKLRPVFSFLRNIKKNQTDISLFNDFRGYLSTIIRKLL